MLCGVKAPRPGSNPALGLFGERDVCYPSAQTQRREKNGGDGHAHGVADLDPLARPLADHAAGLPFHFPPVGDSGVCHVFPLRPGVVGVARGTPPPGLPETSTVPPLARNGNLGGSTTPW